MKNISILLVLISCFTGSIYSQKWTLDRCLAYAQHNNKELLANSQNRKIAELDKKVAISQFSPEISLDAGVDYYWKIPVQSYPGELVGGEKGLLLGGYYF